MSLFRCSYRWFKENIKRMNLARKTTELSKIGTRLIGKIYCQRKHIKDNNLQGTDKKI